MPAAKEDKKNDEYEELIRMDLPESMPIFNAPYVVRSLLLMKIESNI
jgi:hypothetical protein